MFCKYCGSNIDEGQRFCDKCGSEVTRPGSSRKRSRKPLLIGVIAVVIAILVGVIAWRVASDVSAEPQADNPTYISQELYYLQPDDAHVVTDESTGIEFVDNELVIYAAGDVDESRIAEIAAGHNGVIVGRATAAASYQVRFDEVRSYQQLCDLSEELEALDDVEAISRNVALYLDADSETGDPAWNGEAKMAWGLRAINAPDAWDRVQADESVHVGIMDSQFFVDHEDLSGTFAEVMPNYQTSFSAKNNIDDKGENEGAHGTHVAGIIGAKANNLGSVGVAHGCTMYGWSAIDGGKDKAGKAKATLSYGLEVGLTYLVAQCGCRVINMSFGCDDLQIKNSTNSEQFIPRESKQLQEDSRSMENSIRALVRAGYEDFLICKSAGNTGYEGGLADYDFLGYISADDVKSRIIVVGSVGRNSGNKPIVSGFSSGGKRVDIVAPGEEVYSTWYEYSTGLFGNENVTSAYKYGDGTSMATPMVSGAAALVISANPKLSGPQVKRVLTDTAEQGGYAVDDLYFVGLLDAAAAVKEVEGHEANSVGDSAYAAYLKKVEEYQSQYGAHKMATFQYGQEWSVGLAMVQLVDFNGDGNEELLLAYRDSKDSGTGVSGYDREAYHIEVWGYENGAIKKLHSGIPPAGDGGYMPVILYSNPKASESKTILYENDSNGIYGEGHEGTESYFGFDGGNFGLLFESATTTKDGKDSVSVSGSRASTAENGSYGEIKSYNPTYYYLDGLMRASSDSKVVDCERVFQITDQTIAKLRGETIEQTSNATNEEALKKSVAQSAEYEILHWFYADLDNDGDNEAFAITGIQDEHYENEWSEGEIWYADDKGVKRLGGQEAGNAVNGLIEDEASGYKFLSLEHDWHGSGTTSTVFAASNGSCTEALFDLDPIGHFHEEDGQLVGYTNKHDNGFHEYEWHSFEFNPIALTFKSTGVVDVTTWR